MKKHKLWKRPKMAKEKNPNKTKQTTESTILRDKVVRFHLRYPGTCGRREAKTKTSLLDGLQAKVPLWKSSPEKANGGREVYLYILYVYLPYSTSTALTFRRTWFQYTSQQNVYINCIIKYLSCEKQPSLCLGIVYSGDDIKFAATEDTFAMVSYV